MDCMRPCKMAKTRPVKNIVRVGDCFVIAKKEKSPKSKMF